MRTIGPAVTVEINGYSINDSAISDMEAVIGALNATLAEEVAQVLPKSPELGFGLTSGSSTLQFVMALANAGAAAMFVKGLFAYLIKRMETISQPIIIKVNRAEITIPQGLTKEAIDTYIERFLQLLEKEKLSPEHRRNRATNTE